MTVVAIKFWRERQSSWVSGMWLRTEYLSYADSMYPWIYLLRPQKQGPIYPAREACPRVCPLGHFYAPGNGGEQAARGYLFAQ